MHERDLEPAVGCWAEEVKNDSSRTVHEVEEELALTLAASKNGRLDLCIHRQARQEGESERSSPKLLIGAEKLALPPLAISGPRCLRTSAKAAQVKVSFG